MSFIRSLTLASACVVALTTAAQAASDPISADPAKAQGGAYKVEPNHTRIVFSVSHMGFTTWYGDFAGAAGTAAFDTANPAADHVELTIPTGSVTTTNAVLDGELKSPEWFDAAKYPAIAFASHKVTVTGPGHAIVDGDLTFHGVTRPIALDVHFNGGGANPLNHAYTLGFDAVAKLKRSDFGVMTDLPLIGDDVSLAISAAFERAPG